MSQQIANDLLYRLMHEEDLSCAQQLSAEVKWPHRLEDWQFVFELGLGYVAELKGEIVGTALCWKFGESHSSLGMVIVSPEHQGLGIGKKLMNKLLEDLADRTIFLIATESGRPLYERLGFRPTGAYIHQHQGAVFDVPLIPLDQGERIRPIGTSDTAALTRLWTRADGFDRNDAIKALLEVAEGIALDKDGELLGFAFYRRFGRGYVIGPVVAAEERHAKALISHWIGSNIGIFIRIDVRSTSGLSQWLTDLGMPKVDTVISMVRGDLPPKETMQVFAITNQALG